MSTGQPPNFKPTTTTQGTNSTIVLIAGYVTPIIALIGLFVLIALGKVTSDVALPLIGGIVGVHAGAAITNNSSSG